MRYMKCPGVVRKWESAVQAPVFVIAFSLNVYVIYVMSIEYFLTMLKFILTLRTHMGSLYIWYV